MKLLDFLTLSLPFAHGRCNLPLQKSLSNKVEPIETTKNELEPNTKSTSITDLYADNRTENKLASNQNSLGQELPSAVNAETYEEASTFDSEEFPNAEAKTFETDPKQLETVETNTDKKKQTVENKEPQGENRGDNHNPVEKNRRHFLRRRKDQYCSIQCFESVDCSSWANSQPFCNSFRICKWVCLILGNA